MGFVPGRLKGKTSDTEEVGMEETPSKDISWVEDIATQIPVGSSRALGVYGELAELLGQREETLEAYKNRLQQAEEQGNFLSNMFVEPRFPTKSNINEWWESMGINPASQTPLGRILGKGLEALAEGMMFEGVNKPLPYFLGGFGSLGQTLREVGSNEALASITEMVPILASLKEGAKNLLTKPKVLKEPIKNARGITQLQGLGEEARGMGEVSKKEYFKALKRLRKEGRGAVEKLTPDSLSTAEIGEKMDDLLNVASIVKGERILPSKVLNPIKKEINEIKKFKTISSRDKRRLKLYEQFVKEMEGVKGAPQTKLLGPDGKPLDPTLLGEVYKQKPTTLDPENLIKYYRRNNSTIKQGVKSQLESGEVQAFRDINNAISQAFPEMFPKVGTEFKALNEAYRKASQAEKLTQLTEKVFEGKRFNPRKLSEELSSNKTELIKSLGKKNYQQISLVANDMKDAARVFEQMSPSQQAGLWKRVGKVPFNIFVKSGLANLFGMAAPTALLEAGKGVSSIRTGLIERFNAQLLQPQTRNIYQNLARGVKDNNAAMIRRSILALEKIQNKEEQRKDSQQRKANFRAARPKSLSE